MVNTKKFSDFDSADINDSTTQTVGLSSGINTREPKFYSWNTASRPATPFNGLLGLNTDLQQYEWWNSTSSTWVQLTSNSGGFISSWVTVTNPSINATVWQGIVANRTATPVQIVLPATFNPGDEIGVLGLGAGGWSLVANSGQTIQFGSIASSAAGAINSDIQYANIFVRGLVTNTTWTVELANSNPTII